MRFDTPPPVIQCLAPLMMNVSPRLSARVVISVARAAGVGLGDANRRFVAGQDIVGGQPLLRVAAIGHDGGDAAHIALDRDASGDAADLGHFLDHQTASSQLAPCPPHSVEWSCP